MPNFYKEYRNENILTKVGYMAFGCLLTLIGYHFGNIDNNSANAQENAPIVDEVRCHSLVIVGRDNMPCITLKTDFFDRAGIEIYNEDGARRVRLGIAGGVGNIDSGILQIQAKESGSASVALGVDSYGGYMALWNKVLDEPVIQASVTKKGHGSIVIRDIASNQIGVMGPLGIFETKGKSRK